MTDHDIDFFLTIISEFPTFANDPYLRELWKKKSINKLEKLAMVNPKDDNFIQDGLNLIISLFQDEKYSIYSEDDVDHKEIKDDKKESMFSILKSELC